MKKIFVDGQHGTTGLEIVERLQHREDLELITIAHEQRRDQEVRRQCLNEADIVFLCLPDDAARESVAMIDNDQTAVIDASTAHRVAPGWVYGIPELRGQREAIGQSKRIANPGCYATGFNVMMRALTDEKLVPGDYAATTYSITGYSGGGKAMIAEYEGTKDIQSIASRPKNLSLGHKHIPEMTQVSNLVHAPHFLPIVANFYKGMLVFVPLFKHLLPNSVTGESLRQCLVNYYQGEPFIKVLPLNDESSLEDGFLSPLGCNDTNRIDLLVTEKDDQILVSARLDNLGKGASGAAVQNMNILLGVEETTGLSA